jgi:hypothetical protein
MSMPQLEVFVCCCFCYLLKGSSPAAKNCEEHGSNASPVIQEFDMLLRSVHNHSRARFLARQLKVLQMYQAVKC